MPVYVLVTEDSFKGSWDEVSLEGRPGLSMFEAALGCPP